MDARNSFVNEQRPKVGVLSLCVLANERQSYINQDIKEDLEKHRKKKYAIHYGSSSTPLSKK